MARARKQLRPTWDFGRKVRRLLDDRKEQGTEPSTPAALAYLLGLDPGTAMDWIHLGRSPRSKTGRAVARVLGVDPSWLLDDELPYPAPKWATSLDAVLRQVPSDQLGPLAEILKDPIERKRWIASWLAGGGKP